MIDNIVINTNKENKNSKNINSSFHNIKPNLKNSINKKSSKTTKNKLILLDNKLESKYNNISSEANININQPLNSASDSLKDTNKLLLKKTDINLNNKINLEQLNDNNKYNNNSISSSNDINIINCNNSENNSISKNNKSGKLSNSSNSYNKSSNSINSSNDESESSINHNEENEISSDNSKQISFQVQDIKIPEYKKLSLKKRLHFYLEHWITTVFFSIITVWVLFSDDIKMLSTNISSDGVFSTLNIVFMGLFAIEFIISCIVIEGYFLKFFFWLDLISLMSMILDIHWFYLYIINLMGSDDGSKIKSAATIAKAGRGARVGSRAVKILRILRIIRLVRIAKLYKAKTKFSDDNNKNNNNNQIVSEESKVGKKLTDLTTRRVIILVLSMIIGVIIFNSTFYYSPMTSMDFGLKIFNDFDDIDDEAIKISFDLYVNEHKNISTPILYAEVGNLVYGNNIQDQLRLDEKIESSELCDNLSRIKEEYRCFALFDNRQSSKLTSILNIIKTIFICIALAGGSICFSKDTSEMVLEPIESMIEKIQKISKNPIEAMEENEKEDYLKSLDQIKENEYSNKFCCKKSFKKKNKTPLETLVLEKTITKIGALLALGFGEAGSKIIISNMTNTDDTEINPMIKGKKVIAIYGFCDIKNFTDVAEVLEEQVMIFVNEIAEIVHEITADHGGSANKNIGDAFLLVWKFENDLCEFNTKGEVIGLKKNNKAVSELVDNAVISFIKIVTKIYKSNKLDKYRKNQMLLKKIKHFYVKLGFGLHLGWSIEGAIGSTFKIDASYLSPHVSISSKLEEKTREYGVQLLLSEDFYNYLGNDLKCYLRIIDKISFIDNNEMDVYTIDLDLSVLSIEEEDAIDYQDENNKLYKFHKRNERKEKINLILQGKTNQWKTFIENDEDWHLMRMKYINEFYEYYNKGYVSYKKGKWNDAKFELETAQKVLGSTDKACIRMLAIMNKYNFVRPNDWSIIKEAV